MIKYNPKTWFDMIFHQYSRNVIKVLTPALIFMFIYTGAVAFVITDYFELNYKATTAFHSLLGIVLGLFLVFRMNSAYDRWWEARKIWGALVNDSRSWARQMIHYTSANTAEEINELRKLRRRTIYRHIAFLYALKENLRDSSENNYKKFL